MLKLNTQIANESAFPRIQTAQELSSLQILGKWPVLVGGYAHRRTDVGSLPMFQLFI